jgi:hypothetical protein
MEKWCQNKVVKGKAPDRINALCRAVIAAYKKAETEKDPLSPPAGRTKRAIKKNPCPALHLCGCGEDRDAFYYGFLLFAYCGRFISP